MSPSASNKARKIPIQSVFARRLFNDLVGEFFDKLDLLRQCLAFRFQFGDVGNGREIEFARLILGPDGQTELAAGLVVVQVFARIEDVVAMSATHQTVMRIELRVGHFEAGAAYGTFGDFCHFLVPDKQHHPSSNTAGARSNHCA